MAACWRAGGTVGPWEGGREGEREGEESRRDNRDGGRQETGQTCLSGLIISRTVRKQLSGSRT